MAPSWEQLGQRVADARKQLRLTQVDLAAAMGLDRTAITKIESGQRTIDSLELARLASTLHRPISWFVREPPPSITSRRAEREIVRGEDIQLETLAQDVEQLIEAGLLEPAASPAPLIRSIEDTEAAAAAARRTADLTEGEPVWDLVRVVERLGLFAFVLRMDAPDGPSLDGSYVALARGGVALISGEPSSGRRRFTIAHELGHHILADPYAAEWVVGASTSDTEKVINAFAIHFLMPRQGVEPRWQALTGNANPRPAAIRLAVEYGMSWSAACAQLLRLRCLTTAQHEQLTPVKPTSLERAELELTIRDDARAPMLPPGYAAAVARAVQRGKLGPQRAFELLHGTVLERDLPQARSLSLDAMTSELEPLPA